MAKDDYFVLVYKLLRYLYRCLKQGTPADWDLISPNSKDFPVNQEYLAYLLSYLGLGLNGIWAAVLISHVVASIAASITGTVLARKNTAIPRYCRQ